MVPHSSQHSYKNCFHWYTYSRQSLYSIFMRLVYSLPVLSSVYEPCSLVIDCLTIRTIGVVLSFPKCPNWRRNNSHLFGACVVAWNCLWIIRPLLQIRGPHTCGWLNSLSFNPSHVPERWYPIHQYHLATVVSAVIWFYQTAPSKCRRATLSVSDRLFAEPLSKDPCARNIVVWVPLSPVLDGM